MITKTSLKHPSMIRKIKAAILYSVKRSHHEPSGVYVSVVRNRKGVPVMGIIGVKNQGFRVQNNAMEEITDMVKQALKDFHKD